MAVGRQVEKLVATVALPHHLAFGWRKLKLPPTFVRLAGGTLQLICARWSDCCPLMPATKTKGLPCAVLNFRCWADKGDDCHLSPHKLDLPHPTSRHATHQGINHAEALLSAVCWLGVFGGNRAYRLLGHGLGVHVGEQ